MRYYAAAPQPEALDEFPLNPKAVEFGRALGRIEAEREAMKVIGYLVTAAGGVIEVPDSLVVADEAEVLVSSDHVAGTTTYRARAALAREPATEGPPE